MSRMGSACSMQRHNSSSRRDSQNNRNRDVRLVFFLRNHTRFEVTAFEWWPNHDSHLGNSRLCEFPLLPCIRVRIRAEYLALNQAGGVFRDTLSWQRYGNLDVNLLCVAGTRFWANNRYRLTILVVVILADSRWLYL
jgi:hypothetical protein